MILALLAVLTFQEKIALKHEPRKGDVATSATTMEMKVEAQGSKVAIKKSRKARTEWIEAAKKVVEVLEDVNEQTRDHDSQREETKLNKRKVTVTYKDGVASFEGAQDLGAGDKKWLADGDRFYRLLPKHPVAVGESWEVTGRELDAVAEQPEGTTEGSVKLTLKAMREVDGRRCAIVTMKWDVRSAASRLALEGEMTFLVERGYIASFVSKGEIVFVQDGREAARGPFSMEMSTTLK